ncbi:unnamed protein product, partial [Mesorhabditis belari]|uniref:Lipocalin/cytosolic fatty-acid binding domain-containing protein n=1 Tax=Mesorhabditis belari TaxID=2138241 RepID=A0AAF3EU28_9BILA
MSEFQGRWKLVSSERFDDYMKVIGVGRLARLAARNSPVTLNISVDVDRVVVRSSSVFKDYTLQFVIGKEFEEVTIDGRRLLTTFFFEQGHLIQQQAAIEEKDVNSRITRWIHEGLLYTELQAGDVKALRIFKRLH